MDALSAACTALLGSAPRSIEALHGGDLSEVSRVVLQDGRTLVAKAGPLVAREGRMLAAIRAAGAPVPELFGEQAGILLMEALDAAPETPRSWPQFGEDLARLHTHRGTQSGWAEDYAFGTVPIANAPLDDWPRFWAERRLLPFLPHLPTALAPRLERLSTRLAERLPDTATSLLHGDLWRGNTLAGRGGRIHLIDPASYYGDGEVDLAMLHLFGGPGPGFTEGYGPLAPGWQARRAVYSLFPALVHLRLFGEGYRGMVERFLTNAGA
ncbi:fructosamine kinase family protein [Sinisalibacter aestuarii]|uniref:Fructosamine kinase n=1 Tax=Sinisalibacter aestuarii TaxID=2949426 RepID=A0ABQ5LYP3_9RHOB|nr:fructosamine kinase family protein [Sinisalibacter aestuarii]GKY89530.1 fructosamine kinase [Sinisalibacter aestuarii]